MIKDTLSEIISNDKSCLLGLVKFDKSRYLYSIAPLNKNYCYPSNDADISNTYNENKPLRVFGEWSNESNIFNCSGCFISQENENNDVPMDYIYSSTDWEIKTNFSLSNLNNENNNFTILSFVKFNDINIPNIDNVEITYQEIIIDQITNEQTIQNRTENISINRSQIWNYVSDGSSRSNAIKNKIDELNDNSKIQFLKQGISSDLNRVLDINFKIFKDITGIFGKIFVNVYFKDDAHMEKLEYEINDEFLFERWNLLSFIISADDSELKLFNFDIKLCESSYSLAEETQLNYPTSNSSNDYILNIGGKGTSKLKIKNLFIFNRIIEVPEIRFLSKLLNN
jgi:hypothetical protein